MKLFGIDLGRKHIAFLLDDGRPILIMFRQGLFKGVYDVEYDMNASFHPALQKDKIESSPGIVAAIPELAHAAKYQILKVFPRRKK